MIAVCALLMTAPLHYTPVEDTANLPLLNPTLSERKQLKLRLDNGMECLLISDPKADQSAASVRVGVGSWHDPAEYPGMAHFCEHMLFMGTKKYPSDNEFFSLVSDYSGTTNAFTAPDRTVYMFAAQTNGFLGLLDRFAHFFIDPLFNPANIARELHAVDQEFAKNLEHDGWREYMVFKETGNQNHPNHQFSIGNSETLSHIPQSALASWHQNSYSSDRIHLVIYSPLSLEMLKEKVIPLFNQVPKSSTTLQAVQGPVTSPEQIGHITYIKPIKNRQSLTLSWELPTELADDPSHSAEMLAYALQSGQAHSLYEWLKTKQLIDSMSVEVDDVGGRKNRLFQISLELTRKGIEALDTVALHCFEALQSFRTEAFPSYLFEERNNMSQLNYQYQERKDPFDYVAKVGDSIGKEELTTYPRKLLLGQELDVKKMQTLLSTLTPASAAVTLMAPTELMKVTLDRKEPWFQVDYTIRPIPDAWIKKWQKAQANANIQIAPPNPFLPGALSIAPEGANTPELIAKDELGTAYYVRSSEFGGPETIYRLHILTPALDSTPKSSVFASLYLDHLTDLLHPTLAAASSAGLHASFDMSRFAIHVTISGYSPKAPLLLQDIATQMPLNPPTPEQFAIYMARHEKKYANGQKELAVQQGKELLDSLLTPSRSTRQEKLEALHAITYEEFLAFYDKLFEKTYIQGLFAGNITLQEAESAWLDVVHVLSKAPYPVEMHEETKVLHLAAEKGPYRIDQNIGVQGNATLLLLDQGSFSFPNRAAQEILASAIHEPFFSELRSKQKTGYIAQSVATEEGGRLFQTFYVQSNSHQPEDLLFRFEQFLEEYDTALTDHISLERFETLKTSAISSIKTRFRNLSAKATLWDWLAFERDGNFNFVTERIEGLEALSYDEFQDFAHTILNRKNRKRLAICMEGKLAAPFSYQPIAAVQIEEVATYETRQETKELLETVQSTE